MDDARNLQYGIAFDTADAEQNIDTLTEKVDAMEQRIGAARIGAQSFGSDVASSFGTVQTGLNDLAGAADTVTGAVQNVGAAADAASGSLDDISADGVKDIGAAANEASDALDDISADKVREIGAAADAVADALGDTEDAAKGLGEQIGDTTDDAEKDLDGLRESVRKTAQSAKDMGTAFKSSMSQGLQAGQSIAKSFGTGVTGAIDYSRKRFGTFVSDVKSGATKIGTALKHPVQTIRGKLIDALKEADDTTEGLGEQSEDTGEKLEDMGAAGENAGTQIKESIGNALKAVVGFEAIKQGIDLLKQFGQSAIEAFSSAESSAAKFDRVFSDKAADWVDNYADAVHRSTAEIQGFMVQNDAMYKNLGLTADAAEELSEITTSLSYDFGNAFKMEDAEAASLIQSAIQGDTDALTEYGIVLDDTALKASAAALGYGTNIEALDDAAAAQVRLNAILEQSSDIQQAAINDTGGMTNSIKSLKGIMSDFLADAGEKFAPAVEGAIGVLLDEWPTLQPVLLSFVGTLADGLSDAVPVLMDLAQDLIPAVSQTLGVLMDVAEPVLGVFGDLASTVLPPLANIIGELASTVLPPLRDIFDELNYRVIQPLIPVIEELSDQLLPVFGEAFGAVADVISPLAEAFMPLLEDVLPLFGTLVSELATELIPPLTEIIGTLAKALEPVIELGIQIVQAILPAASPLIEAIGTLLSGVIVPVLDAISPLLETVTDVLGTVVGWVSDLIGFFSNGVSTVVDWFAGLFGGAKDSTDAVEELTGAVSDLDGAAGEETSLVVDTSDYTTAVSAASENAQSAIEEATTAARDISNENYGLMADDAETAYSRMTLDAEDAWERMTAAADNGADSIIKDFQRITSAAQSMGTVNLKVTSDTSTGTDIPHNAAGTDAFEGGWTHINEEGGELAYLPSGSAIIPADKTDEIINNTSNAASYTDQSTFAPQISITLGGETSPDVAAMVAQQVKEQLEKFWREKQEEQYHRKTLQGAYAY